MALFGKNNKENDKSNVELTTLEPPKEAVAPTDKQEDNDEDTIDINNIDPKFFGPLKELVFDKHITDIDYNGRRVWTTKEDGERSKTDISLEYGFVSRFTQRVANAMNKPFNKVDPILEADARTSDGTSLRISIVHESVTKPTGRSICIRKTPPYSRITTMEALKSAYITPEMLAFLINSVRAKLNIVICGEPGAGKTELGKFLSQFIPDTERVITIEDNLEWHYSELKPESDSLEMQINEHVSYKDAIKTCLRQNPKWMMISEIRDDAVIDYIRGLSTGVNGLTTTHTDDVRSIPSRMMNMAGAEARRSIENDIYSFVNVGVLVSRMPQKEGRDRRFVDQIGIFYNESDRNYDKYLFYNQEPAPNVTYIPDSLWNKFTKYGISNPFYDENTMKCAKKLNIKFSDLKGYSEDSLVDETIYPDIEDKEYNETSNDTEVKSHGRKKSAKELPINNAFLSQ